jgi:hypothetical protein
VGSWNVICVIGDRGLLERDFVIRDYGALERDSLCDWRSWGVGT